jgi:hypothetical protein
MCSSVSYSSARSWGWIDLEKFQLFLAIYIGFFLSRVAATAEKPFNIICLSILLFETIFIIYFVFKNRAAIGFCQTMWPGMLTSGSISIIFNLFRKLGLNLDATMIVWAWIFGCVLFSGVFSLIDQFTTDKLLLKLDQFGSETLDDLFPTAADFLKTVRGGFQFGHQTVFEWVIFKEATKKWPRSEGIWLQWLRFVLIYPDQGKLVQYILKELKAQEFTSYHVKFFEIEVDHIMMGLEKGNSKQGWKESRVIKKMTRQLRETLLWFWQGIAQGSVIQTYSEAAEARDLIERCEEQFAHSIRVFPNSRKVYSSYAKFLKDIICDPKEAAIWQRRAAVMNDLRHSVIDRS